MFRVLLLIFITLFPLRLYGSTVAGKISKANGKVDIVPDNGFKGIPWKKLNGKLKTGDIVRTKRKSTADINFIDKTELKLSENTRLIIERYIPSKDVTIKNPYGKVVFKISKRVKGKFSVETPIALIGVKGTEFLVNSSYDKVTVIVKSGTVEIKSFSFPEKQIILRDREKVTLYPQNFGKPEKLPQPLINSIFNKIEEKEDNNILQKETKEEVMEEITKETTEKITGTNFNINIPYVSIEGL